MEESQKPNRAFDQVPKYKLEKSKAKFNSVSLMENQYEQVYWSQKYISRNAVKRRNKKLGHPMVEFGFSKNWQGKSWMAPENSKENVRIISQ